MPRATCRCGQLLNVPDDGTERVVCPQCGAKVRVRRPPSNPSTPAVSVEEGYIRFSCPCGRRLKVSAGGGGGRPSHGKCPDCGRVVPVPETTRVSPSDPETPTEELTEADRLLLDRWTRRHLDEAAGTPGSTHVLPTAPAPFRTEAGLRVCPGCGRPVHMGAANCTECGIPVPRR